MANQSHINPIPATISGVADWARKAAVSFNQLLRGGPFPLLWKDNLNPITAGNLGGGVNSPTWTTFQGSTGAYVFSATVEEEMFVYFHINHDYARGTKLYPHVHWTANTASTNTCRWGFEYTLAKGHQQEAFGATSTIYIEQAFSGTAYTHMIGEAADGDAIDGAALGIEPDTLIVARVFRDATHVNDNLAVGAFGLFIDLHYQAERWGTPQKSPDFYV